MGRYLAASSETSHRRVPKFAVINERDLQIGAAQEQELTESSSSSPVGNQRDVEKMALAKRLASSARKKLVKADAASFVFRKGHLPTGRSLDGR